MNVSSEGERGGGQKLPIILNTKSTKALGEGVINMEKWANVVYGWPLRCDIFFSFLEDGLLCELPYPCKKEQFSSKGPSINDVSSNFRFYEWVPTLVWPPLLWLIDPPKEMSFLSSTAPLPPRLPLGNMGLFFLVFQSGLYYRPDFDKNKIEKLHQREF